MTSTCSRMGHFTSSRPTLELSIFLCLVENWIWIGFDSEKIRENHISRAHSQHLARGIVGVISKFARPMLRINTQLETAESLTAFRFSFSLYLGLKLLSRLSINVLIHSYNLAFHTQVVLRELSSFLFIFLCWTLEIREQMFLFNSSTFAYYFAPSLKL